jgi:hypothetical protein
MNNWGICWFFEHIFTVDLKGLTARRFYKSFGVKGLKIRLLYRNESSRKHLNTSAHVQLLIVHRNFIHVLQQ